MTPDAIVKLKRQSGFGKGPNPNPGCLPCLRSRPLYSPASMRIFNVLNCFRELLIWSCDLSLGAERMYCQLQENRQRYLLRSDRSARHSATAVRHRFLRPEFSVGVLLLLADCQSLEDKSGSASEPRDLSLMGRENLRQGTAQQMLGRFPLNHRTQAVPCGHDVAGDQDEAGRKGGNDQLQPTTDVECLFGQRLSGVLVALVRQIEQLVKRNRLALGLKLL
jgi:hypothetical protein